MSTRLPKTLVMIASALILTSGLVSIVIAVGSGAVFYEPDPHGLFGHVGIVSGLAAIAIAVFLFWFSRLEFATTRRLWLAGMVSVAVGHLGGVAGALLVGTAGVVCCYLAGGWFIVQAVASKRPGGAL